MYIHLIACAGRLTAKVLIFCWGISFLSNVHAQDLTQKIKAAYLYKILQFVTFPEDALHEPGVVNACILGDDQFGSVLDEIDGARIEQGVLKIHRISGFKQDTSLERCNALYVVESERRRVRSIMRFVDSRRILTISEFAPFIRFNGLIELFEEDDRIRFRINEKLVREADYRVAAQLIELGVRQ